MSALAWLRRLGSKGQSKTGGTLILPVLDQIKAWRKVSGKMGESGQIVEFPMSPEEVASDNEESTRIDAIRRARLKNLQKHVVAFELAESGIVIEFSDTTSDITADDTGE